MVKGDNLGELDQLVLLALIRLGPNAYGVTIRQEISERTGREANIGAVYSALQRMEERGYVTSRVGEKTLARGGRAKRYFKIEGQGEAALDRSLLNLSKMGGGLRPVVA